MQFSNAPLTASVQLLRILQYVMIIGALALFSAAVTADASQTCPDDPPPGHFLRLVDGITPFDGRIEYRPRADSAGDDATSPSMGSSDSEWGTICGKGLKDSSAMRGYLAGAVCRSLGFTDSIDSTIIGFGAGNATKPIWIDGPRCPSGDKAVFSNCSLTPPTYHTCSHADDLGVRCVPHRKFSQFKLVNGTAPTRGLVLFRPMPHMPWGTISSANFIFATASSNNMRKAICRSLGFTTVLPSAAKSEEFGSAHPTAPTYARYTSCSSTFLENCSYSGYLRQYSWGAAEQLGLYCEEPILGAMDVRLVGGSTSWNGQIQLRPAGTSDPWRFIAYNALLLAPNYNYDIKRYPHNWRALNALCRHAGHTSVVNASFRFFGTSPLDGAISPAYVEAVTCPTNAQSLSDCALVPNADFGMTIPAGVDCFPELTAGRWQYRLHRTDVSGKASKGIAQMRIGDDGQWGSIMTSSTNNFGLWDAFCNMVGYTRGSTKITRNLTPYNGGDSGWTSDSSDAFSPRHLANIYCNYYSFNLYNPSLNHGSRNLSKDCQYDTVGSVRDPARHALVVDCDTGAEAAGRSNWKVRIANGGNGLIEFQPGPTMPWGTVCSTDSDALPLFCRMAGYQRNPYANRITYPSIPSGPNSYDNYPSYLHGLYCWQDDEAEDIRDCYADHFEGEECDSYSTAAIDCHYVPNNPREWKFRLIGEPYDLAVGRGRVEVQLAPRLDFGPICSRYWDYYFNGEVNNAAVCRSLGYKIDSWPLKPRRINAAQFGFTSAPRQLTEVQCTSSSYMYLQNCTSYTIKRVPDAVASCSGYSDVAVECFPPIPGGGSSLTYEYRAISVDLHRYPSIIRAEARINNGAWSNVYMDTTMYSNDVNVLLALCRMAGYGEKTPVRNTSFPNNNPYLFERPSCTSSATSLNRCSTDVNTYDKYTYYGSSYQTVAECDPTVSDDPDPTKWLVRLANQGPGNSSGRVEIKPLPHLPWGTICDDGFSLQSAIAVCRSLGFDYEARMAAAGPGAMSAGPIAPYMQFGAGTGTIYFSYMNCYGSKYIQNCTAYTWKPTNCGHSEDQGVNCEPPIMFLREFEFRLVPVVANGTGIFRVEMRPNNTAPWGTIYQSSKPLEVARAACLQGGYAGVSPNFYTTFAGTGPVYFQNIVCPTNAEGLANCTFPFPTYTTHTNDLTVECATLSDKPQWEFKLSDGEHVKPHFGRLMLKPTPWTQWGTVSGSMAGTAAAAAACRSVGYTTSNGFRDPINAQFTTNLSPVLTDGPVWLYGVNCASSATHLQNCSSSWRGASHASDVWVDCYPIVTARLVNGGAEGRGRVEVMYNNWTKAWGTVCSDGFIRSPAAWQAACRSAGFTNVTEAAYGTFGPGSGSIHLSNVFCDHSERVLGDCPLRPFGQHSCDHSEDAGVDCYPGNAYGAWRYRLAGVGATATKGRFEVRPSPDSSWGMLCPARFNNSHASWIVACRSVGIETTRAVPACFGAGFAAMYLDNVRCVSSSARELRECEGADPYAPVGCTSRDAVGLDCNPPPENATAWEFRLDNTTIVPNGNGSNASFPVAGTLLVRFSPSEPWGTVCNNNAAQLANPNQLAETVCRTLGLLNPLSTPILYATNASVVAAPLWLPIVLSNIHCAEGDDLRKCPHNPMYDHSCDHSMDIHVDCSPERDAPYRTLTMPLTRTVELVSTPSAEHEPTPSIVAPRTVSPSPSAELAPTPSANVPSTATTSLTVDAPHTESRHTVTPEIVVPPLQFSCDFTFALASTPGLTDRVVWGSNVIINISLPNWQLDTFDETLKRSPLRFVDGLSGTADGERKNKENKRSSTMMPFAVPTSVIRIHADANVGASEPRGYRQTYGSDGQSPKNPPLPPTASQPQPNDPRKDALLAGRFSGRVFCEVITAKTIRCVIPRSVEYELFVGERLEARLAAVLSTAWVFPPCGVDGYLNMSTVAPTDTSGDDASPLLSSGSAAAATSEEPLLDATNATAALMYESFEDGLAMAYFTRTRANAASEMVFAFNVDPAEESVFGAAVDSLGPVAGTVSVLASLFGGASPMDIQLITLLSQSECMGAIDRKSTSILRYFISPLYDFGFAAIGFGNLAAALAFAGAQFALARYLQSDRRIREIDSWAATRFPSYSYACAQLVFVGICFGSISMIAGGAIADGEEDGGAASYVLGTAGTLTSLAIIGGIGYFALFVVTGKFIQYTQFLSRPCYYRWIYPLGFWEAPAQRLAYGYFINRYRDGERLRLFSALSFTVAFIVALLMLIPMPCEVRFSLAGFVFLTAGILHAALRPARLPFTNVLNVASQLLSALLAFLGASQIVHPTVEMMNAKLAIVLLQILVVGVGSVASLAISIFERVRWSKFRDQKTDEFADDDKLLAQKPMAGIDDIFDIDLGDDGGGDASEKAEEGHPAAGVGSDSDDPLGGGPQSSNSDGYGEDPDDIEFDDEDDFL